MIFLQIALEVTLYKVPSEGEFSRGFIFASHFVSNPRGFNFANWLPVDFSRGFIFANLSFTNVLYNLIFSWFVLQLVVCESWNSYPKFSIFQIALLGYKRLNSRLNAQEEIKRSRYNKKIYIFLSVLSLLILFDVP